MTKKVTSDQLSVIRNIILIGFVLFLLACVGHAADIGSQVAGQFYPAEKKALSQMTDYYLSKYRFIENSGDLLALVSPHAGYEYSGIVAAYGYKQLEGRKYDTVVIMAPSHNVLFDGLAVNPSGKFVTPLGEVEIDEEMASKLIGHNSRIMFNKEAFLKEHAIEVQLPFLQKTLKKFKIVPVIFGNQSIENCEILSNAIVDTVGEKKILLVASTDLSHYLSYEAANEMDAKVVQAFSEGDLVRLITMIATREVEMCGYGPVITAMYTSDRLGGNSYEVFKYLNSGNTTTDMDRVVGYMSAGIYKRPLVLDSMQKARLLQFARETIESYIIKKEVPTYEVFDKDLLVRSGVFVTLMKSKKLRGCVGYIYPVKPLYLAVQDMAISAAINDGRYPPVREEELKDIDIEISVLSPMKRVQNIEEIQIGRDGLYIVKGRASGLLLPQVATDNGFTREEFLDNVCYKAGLPASAWKDKESKLFSFSAEVFRE